MVINRHGGGLAVTGYVDILKTKITLWKSVLNENIHKLNEKLFSLRFHFAGNVRHSTITRLKRWIYRHADKYFTTNLAWMRSKLINKAIYSENMCVQWVLATGMFCYSRCIDCTRMWSGLPARSLRLYIYRPPGWPILIPWIFICTVAAHSST